MSLSREYTSYITEKLAVAGSISTRKMFGGMGFYIDDVFCAIITSDNRFYFRVGPDTIDDYQMEGMSQFEGRKGSSGMPYYEVPERIMENPTDLIGWAQAAKNAAISARKTQL